MLKTIFNMALGAIIAGAIGTAYALVGTPPGTGFQTIDGAWLNGLSGGLNETYIYNQQIASPATQLPSGFAIMEVDSAVNNNGTATSGVAVPICVPGTEFLLNNSTGVSFTVYPSTIVNALTGAVDTINGLTSIASAAARSTLQFSCARPGSWIAK